MVLTGNMLCSNCVVDGCGTYCKAINMDQLLAVGRIDKDYPHKHWRTDCWGNRLECRFNGLYIHKDETFFKGKE